MTLEECRATIDAHRLATITVALLEYSGIIICWHIPVASHHIIDVLTPFRSLWSRFTSAETEFSVRDKVRPFMKLLKVPKGVGEDQSTDWVTIPIRTVRIQLASCITFGNVDFSEISNTSDLNEIWRLDKVSARDCTIWNQSCAIARLDTPGYLDALRVSDNRVRTGIRWGPNTPIIDVIDVSILAHRGLTVICSTLVCPALALFCRFWCV